MSNEQKGLSALHVGIGSLAGLLMGIALGALGSATYFLSKNLGELKLHTDGHIAQTVPNQTYLPVESEGNDAPALPEREITPGDGFLFTNEVQFIIPEGTPRPDAKKLLFDALNGLPGIYVGEGEGEIMVIFDPVCPKCHDLYVRLDKVDGYKGKIRAKFIPAHYFANVKESSIASIFLLGKLEKGEVDTANEYLKRIVYKDSPFMDEWISPSKQTLRNLDTATMAIMQTGARVPFVVFKNKKTGAIEIIDGLPDAVDLVDAGKIN